MAFEQQMIHTLAPLPLSTSANNLPVYKSSGYGAIDTEWPFQSDLTIVQMAELYWKTKQIKVAWNIKNGTAPAKNSFETTVPQYDVAGTPTNCTTARQMAAIEDIQWTLDTVVQGFEIFTGDDGSVEEWIMTNEPSPWDWNDGTYLPSFRLFLDHDSGLATRADDIGGTPAVSDVTCEFRLFDDTAFVFDIYEDSDDDNWADVTSPGIIVSVDTQWATS